MRQNQIKSVLSEVLFALSVVLLAAFLGLYVSALWVPAAMCWALFALFLGFAAFVGGMCVSEL